MVTIFTLCAVIGGTVLVCQFVLTLIGLGGDDLGSGDSDVGADHFDAGVDHADSPDPVDSHESSILFSVLTFRTVVAALAFFGLAGLAGNSAGWPDVQVLAVALMAGAAAMFGVHHLMQLFYRLKADGTVRLSQAVDQEAVVYLRIPAHRSGHGKVHVVLKEQTVELQAETTGEAIPGGAVVRIIEFLGSDIVSVSRVDQAKDADARAVVDAPALSS